MKALFHQYGSIVEPDIIAALETLGVEVLKEDMEVKQKAIDSDTRIKVMAENILINHPDFVFSINYFPYISSICEKLNTIYICLTVDCPVMEIYSETIKNKCNRIFLFDRAQYESVCGLNPEGIFYIPLAVNTERWDEIKGNGYKYDVSFVGSLYTEKSPYPTMRMADMERGYFDGLLKAQGMLDGLTLLDEVIKPDNEYLQKVVKGNPVLFDKYSLSDPVIDTDSFAMVNNILGFELSALDRINLIKSIGQNFKVDLFTRSEYAFNEKNIVFHGGVSTHTEMPKVFKESKININHTMRSIRTGLPQRIWDIAGCGGFILTNYQEEIPEFLEIGEDIAVYESEAECIELINYFLTHDDEREAMAHNAYTKVKNSHTYMIRMAQILTKVFKA